MTWEPKKLSKKFGSHFVTKLLNVGSPNLSVYNFFNKKFRFFRRSFRNVNTNNFLKCASEASAK
jgi:hypothetical protein